MATIPKGSIRLRSLFADALGYALRRHWEGITQTFPAHAPLVMTGGYLVEAANPATDVFGFAVREGRNSDAAGDELAEFVPAVDGIEFNASFLGALGANNTLAATDFGGSYDLIKVTDLLGTGRDGWCVQDAAAAAAVKMVRSETDYHPPAEVDNSHAKAGDINARPTFVVLASVRSYD